MCKQKLTLLGMISFFKKMGLKFGFKNIQTVTELNGCCQVNCSKSQEQKQRFRR